MRPSCIAAMLFVRSTQESLHELGLDYVSENLIKRGILSEDEDRF